nr:MAG TPA: hypothetical protein [Caudoviricetes sp.]
MIKGETKTGFKFEIEEEVLDDYELLETLVDADNGNNMALFSVIDMVLGDEQKKALKEHLREIHGRVPASAMIAEIMDIIEKSGSGKNS